MASYNPQHDENAPPLHQLGTLLSSPPEYSTIATFPPGSFLENLAIRADGTVLVSGGTDDPTAPYERYNPSPTDRR